MGVVLEVADDEPDPTDDVVEWPSLLRLNGEESNLMSACLILTTTRNAYRARVTSRVSNLTIQ